MVSTVDGVTVIDNFSELWNTMILFTLVGNYIAFYCAGIIACRVMNKSYMTYIYIPILFGLVGVILGFCCGAFTAALIAAVYISVPYSLPYSVVIGLGIGQSIIIIYFHLGRAEFVHQA